jgi:hypothetical protein
MGDVSPTSENHEFKVLLYPERSPDRSFVAHELSMDIVASARSQLQALMNLLLIIEDFLSEKRSASPDRPVYEEPEPSPWYFHEVFEGLEPLPYSLTIPLDRIASTIILHIRQSHKYINRKKSPDDTPFDNYDSGDSPTDE